MKKLMALALAVVMVLSLGVTAIAEEKPTLKFETEPFTQEGQTKEVKLIAENFGAISAVQFTVIYDAEKLELVSVDVSALTVGTNKALVNKKTPGEIIVVWDADFNEDFEFEYANIEGVLATFQFKAISDELGEAMIGFSEEEDIVFADDNFSDFGGEVEIDEESAKIEIEYEHEHAWTEWKEVEHASCEGKGLEERYCTAYNGTCDASETRPVEALGHNWDKGAVQDAKCGETADILYTCQRCQETKTETGAKVEHDFGEWTETVAPGCETKGEERRDCERAGCDHYETRPVAALGHDMGEWFETTAPGCETKGELTRYCSRCQHSETNPVEALGHDWDDGVITNEPGCESTGVKTFTCQRCQDTYTKVVDALGHTWDEGEVTLEPTCTTDGNRLHKCTVEGCPGEYNESIAALGHDMGKWVVVKEATGMEDGLERRECSRCDHYEERVIKNIMFLDPTVIIDMNGKTEAETNPNTGAPVMGAYAVIALAVAASFFKKSLK